MPIIGSLNLPVADRSMRWDGPGAKRRVFEFCSDGGKVDVACAGRAFLWRDPSTDPQTQSSVSLGFADVVRGRLMIVPRGVAATAGGRGVGAADIPEDAKSRIESRICQLYARVRAVHEDWPACPLQRNESQAITAAATGEPVEGPVVFEGQATGDKRFIEEGALTWRDASVPLIVDLEEMDHSGRVVGTIDSFRREGQAIIGTGALSETENAETAEAIVRVRELLNEEAVGVSIELDDIELDEDRDDLLVVTKARIRHVAIVDVPALAEARLELLTPEPEQEPAVVAHALGASIPPEWFADPRFGDESDKRLVWQEPERPEEVRQLGAPFTVTDEGRIWGHVVLWGRCHVGYAGTCVRPPKEPASYRGFLTGERVPGVPTGVLTVGTTHASLRADADEANRHYADTGRAAADIAIGADTYGIWAAGALRPDVDRVGVEALRGSALSGDWRYVGGRLRLIGVLAVNAPGFRISRAIAASAALVTVGPGCEECPEEVSIEERVEALERRLAAG